LCTLTTFRLHADKFVLLRLVDVRVRLVLYLLWKRFCINSR